MSPSNVLLSTLLVPTARVGVLSPKALAGLAAPGQEGGFSSFFDHDVDDITGEGDPAAVLAMAAEIPLAASDATAAIQVDEAAVTDMLAPRPPRVPVSQTALPVSAQPPDVPVAFQRDNTGPTSIAPLVGAAVALPFVPPAGSPKVLIASPDIRGDLAGPPVATPPSSWPAPPSETARPARLDPPPAVALQTTDRQTAPVVLDPVVVQPVPATASNCRPMFPGHRLR